MATDVTVISDGGKDGVQGWTCGRLEGWKGWKGGGPEGRRGGGTECAAYDKGRTEGTTRDDPEATQNFPTLAWGTHPQKFVTLLGQIFCYIYI